MRTFSELRYPSLNLSADIHSKNVPATFQKDLKTISIVIARTSLVIRTVRRTDAGNDNTPSALGPLPRGKNRLYAVRLLLKTRKYEFAYHLTVFKWHILFKFTPKEKNLKLNRYVLSHSCWWLGSTGSQVKKKVWYLVYEKTNATGSHVYTYMQYIKADTVASSSLLANYNISAAFKWQLCYMKAKRLVTTTTYLSPLEYQPV